MGHEIVRQSLLQQVYDAIKDDIISRYYQPGDKLVIRMLCERYHVSDTPIKQALNRLVSEGFVVAIRGKGLWVREFTREELQDLLRTRFMIESYCVRSLLQDAEARTAAVSAMGETLEAHRRFLDSAGSSLEASEYRVHQEFDRAFHLGLVSGVHSSHILRIYQDLQGHIYMSYIYRLRGPHEAEITFREHRRFHEALASGSPDALEALRAHFISLCTDIDIPFRE